jgi:hypothetical protein
LSQSDYPCLDSSPEKFLVKPGTEAKGKMSKWRKIRASCRGQTKQNKKTLFLNFLVTISTLGFLLGLVNIY